MNREHMLFRSSLVRIARYDHPPGRAHRDPAEETARGSAFSFVERGAFQVMRGRTRWRMTPEVIFVTHPGFTYRCAHDESVPGDVCLSAILSPGLVGEVESVTGLPWRARAPIAPLTNRLAYLGRRLQGGLSAEAGPLAIETLVGEMAAALGGETRPATGLYRPRRLAWYAERVDAARRMLDERPGEPHSLWSISRQVGMSPFHFARVFSELAGAPPHRYLLQARLRRAAGMLREGASVTQTCPAAGFNNLGHFIRSFRAAYGVTPSRYRV